MPRTILVTGGAGFIGASFVVRHLARFPHDHIIVLDALTYAASLDRLPDDVRASPRFEFLHGSVVDDTAIAAGLARADTVVHFAAETHVPRSIADNLTFVTTDVVGTQVLLSQIVARLNQIERLVHISSSEVYGSAVHEPMSEDHPLQPTTPYAAAKCGADRLVHAFAQTYGVPAVILRPFNNYGPGQHLEKVVPRFIAAALLGEPLIVHGDGSARRDWVFVDDTCAAVECALEAPIGRVRDHVFNVCTGVATSVLSIAEMVAEAVGNRQPEVRFVADRPGQVALHRGDFTKAEQVLGFRARSNLAVGLETTVRWYREHRDRWQAQVDTCSVPIVGRDGVIHHW